VDPRVRVSPILTAGQLIPLTGGSAGQQFRFPGVPDGMGVSLRRGSSPAGDRLLLLVNHEFTKTQGGAAGPFPSGARTSEITLAMRGEGAWRGVSAASGRCPVERLYYGEPPALVARVRSGLASLCSAFLADERVGFDRPVFLHGEESWGSDTFDGKGGLAWADFDGGTWALPGMGRAAWENIVAAPFTGSRTVLFGLEDGPPDGDGIHSQLYLYVGEKSASAAEPLARNGLRGGRLYVFAGDDASRNTEAGFVAKGGSITGHWSGVDWDQTDEALDAQSVAAGGFGFIRIEDGAADPVRPGTFYFVTTGKPGSANLYGRLYRLEWDAANPVSPARLTLLLDGTEGMVSPDNIDVNRHGEIAICEDPNYDLSTLKLTRDSSLWVYDTRSGTLTRIAELDRDAARAHALAADPGNSTVDSSDHPGGWELSGVIDAEEYLGRGSWLLDVQAHSLRIVPVSETVQGGQLLHLVWEPGDRG
jgi:hypothetical protein